jgi:hypothetical protein
MIVLLNLEQNSNLDKQYFHCCYNGTYFLQNIILLI